LHSSAPHKRVAPVYRRATTRAAHAAPGIDL